MHNRIPRLPNRAISAVAVGFALLATGVLPGCRPGGSQGSPPAKRPAAPTATQVSVTTVSTATLSDIANVTGSLSSLQDVTVGVKTAGKVVAVYAREGDVVRAGQIVAQQDTTDLLNQLDVQRANLLAAQTRQQQATVAHRIGQTNLALTDAQTLSAVRQAEAGLQQAQELFNVAQNGAREQERQEAEDALKSAQADRDRARSDLKRYEDLYRQQAVSAQQLDQVQATADSAEARYSSAAASLSLVREGSRPEDIRRAKAGVEQARQAVVTARANRDQVALRKSDVETARVGILSAMAGVAQAAAAVRLAEQAVRDASVRTPITGMVAERKVEPGMQLSAAKTDVMRIVALDSIYFDAQLSETQFSGVRIGQTVEIAVDAVSGRTFAGTVSKVFPVASSTARSFTARIRIANEGRLLRPQMFARGRIVLGTHRNVVAVPRNAILDFNTSSGRVMLAVNGTAVEKNVKLGFQEDGNVEIMSGNVHPGAKLIVMGQAEVQNGDRIQVTSGAPAPTGSAGAASN